MEQLVDEGIGLKEDLENICGTKELKLVLI